MKKLHKLSVLFLLLLLTLVIPARAADDGAQFSVTVPSVLPVAVDAAGNVSVATDARIVNNSSGAVKLDAIRVEPQNSWQIMPWGTDYRGIAVDSRQFSMRFNGAGVPASGSVDVGEYASIDSGDELPLTYDAQFAVQSSNLSETVANVVFTVSWDGHGPLSGISIASAPSKTEYNVGDAFDADNMVVKATYADGAESTVTGWTVTDGASLAEGQTSVTVSYTQDGVTKTASCPITVNAKKLSSIAVTTAPAKTVYETGESFNKNGMVVRAYYTNGTNAVITGYTVSSGALTNTDTTGSAKSVSVTISYTEDGVTKTTTQSVSVKNTLQSIAVTKQPTKTVYSAGNSFDTSGMTVVAYFTSGSRTLSYYNNSSSYLYYTITNGSSLYAGQSSVTVSYTNGGVTKYATVAVRVASGPLPETIAVGDSIKFGSLYLDGTIRDGSYTNNYYTGGIITFGDSKGTQSINWIKVSDNMLIADRNLLVRISWDAIYENGFMYGTTVEIDGGYYTVRLLTGGTTQYDTNNEWDQYIVNGPVAAPSWNIAQEPSYTQTIINDGYQDFGVIRGDHYVIDAYHGGLMNESYNGFRPALIIGGSADNLRSIKNMRIGERIRLGGLYMGGTLVNAGATQDYNNQTLYFGDITDPYSSYMGISWIKVSDNMLIADRNLLDCISWDTLNQYGLIYGTQVTFGGKTYTLRSLTGGSSQYDTSSEWNRYIVNGYKQGDNNTWHWSMVWSWTQTTYGSNFVGRGAEYADSWTARNRYQATVNEGFRPCLILND